MLWDGSVTTIALYPWYSFLLQDSRAYFHLLNEIAPNGDDDEIQVIVDMSGLNVSPCVVCPDSNRIETTLRVGNNNNKSISMVLVHSGKKVRGHFGIASREIKRKGKGKKDYARTNYRV